MSGKNALPCVGCCRDAYRKQSKAPTRIARAISEWREIEDGARRIRGEKLREQQ